jgi:hypothetical protein
MYGSGLESMIFPYLLFGIASLLISLAGFLLIGIAIARAAGGRSGGQPPSASGTQPNHTFLWRLLVALAMFKGGQHAGSAELGARQSAINAGFDPTPRS